MGDVLKSQWIIAVNFKQCLSPSELKFTHWCNTTNANAKKGATKENKFYSQHFVYKLFLLETCVEWKIKGC